MKGEKSFQLHGNGVNDDSKAIQKMLDQRGVIYIPYGTYKIHQTLKVHSGTTLIIHPNAKFIFAENAGKNQNDFLLTNSDHKNGNNNITIEGGIWDGNCNENKRGPDLPTSYTGVLLNFFNIQNLTIKNLTLMNPVSYHTRLCNVSNFLIENIKLRTQFQRPNQDGIHLGGNCSDGIIRNIDARGRAVPNDDLIALNADDANHRAQNLGKINGPIKNLYIHNLYAESCHSFIRILSCHNPITNINIHKVEGGCEACAINMDAGRKCAVPVFDPLDPQFKNGVGMVENIHISSLLVHKSSSHLKNPLIDIQTKVNNFCIEDFARDLSSDALPECPTFYANFIPNSLIELHYLTKTHANELIKKSQCQIKLTHLNYLRRNQFLTASLKMKKSNDYCTSHINYIKKMTICYVER